MIKRTYFMAAKQYHGDRSGSFGYNTTLTTHTSWLPDPASAFRVALTRCEGSITGKGNLQIVTFNRV